jgi:hypothetical protein
VKGIIRMEEVSESLACLLCLSVALSRELYPMVWNSLVDISVLVAF